jgi:hypothetical protein
VQETVGVAVVLDTGKMRLDLRDVQRHLENKLHHTKWPLVLVYMDSLPKSATNKVLRVNFAKRAAIPETHVYTRPWEALFEAVAPPPGARTDTRTHTGREASCSECRWPGWATSRIEGDLPGASHGDDALRGDDSLSWRSPSPPRISFSPRGWWWFSLSSRALLTLSS